MTAQVSVQAMAVARSLPKTLLRPGLGWHWLTIVLRAVPCSALEVLPETEKMQQNKELEVSVSDRRQTTRHQVNPRAARGRSCVHCPPWHANEQCMACKDIDFSGTSVFGIHHEKRAATFSFQPSPEQTILTLNPTSSSK